MIYEMVLFCKGEEEDVYEGLGEEIDVVRWHEVSRDVLGKGG